MSAPGAWQGAKLNEQDSRPACQTTARGLSQKGRTREPLPYVSLTALAWIPGQCSLFPDWWWPCRRAVFYIQGRLGAQPVSVFPQFALCGAVPMEGEKGLKKPGKSVCSRETAFQLSFSAVLQPRGDLLVSLHTPLPSFPLLYLANIPHVIY